MNVLFMTIAYPKAGQRNIYVDLMQEFERTGHQVYITCSTQRRDGQQTTMNQEEGKIVLRTKTGNLTGQVNLIEKGLTTLLLEGAFIKAINRYFKGIKFDLVIYSTPPITFSRAIKHLKNRDSARTYLLLKDIFPQNAIDIGLMRDGSLIHRYFRAKEKMMYALSDYIGCMSKANVDYVVRNNPEVLTGKVEVCPNSVMPVYNKQVNKTGIRNKYGIPDNCRVFICGGNLGKPQGMEFIIKSLKDNINLDDRFFVICGNGSEYHKAEKLFKEFKPNNMLLISGLPKLEYDELVAACDVGLIFLDNRFTIPNFPSRMLSYMEYAMPVVACTDVNTDIGKLIIDGQFGWWCESDDSGSFNEIVGLVCSMPNKELIQTGANARKYLEDNYMAKHSYEIIMKHLGYEGR